MTILLKNYSEFLATWKHQLLTTAKEPGTREKFPVHVFVNNLKLYKVLNTKVSEVAQSCPTLCNPMDCSLPGFSVLGIFQARILEWVAISFSRRSFWPRNRIRVSRIVGRRFTVWATREGWRNTKVIKLNNSIKIQSLGTSLVVQCLRIRLPMQGTWVQSLVRELRSHMPRGN